MLDCTNHVELHIKFLSHLHIQEFYCHPFVRITHSHLIRVDINKLVDMDILITILNID